jgi:hypothetical protein
MSGSVLQHQHINKDVVDTVVLCGMESYLQTEKEK